MNKQERKEIKDLILGYVIEGYRDKNNDSLYFYVGKYTKENHPNVTFSEEVKLQNGKSFIVDYHVDDIIGIEVI